MIPLTLSRYILNRFLLGFGASLVVFVFFAFCFDFLELNRRFGGYDIPLDNFIIVTVLRLPFLLVKILPFAILLGSLYTFFSLNRHGELIVARACGCSAWQFMIPVTLASCVLGIIGFTVINPLAATSYRVAEDIKSREIKGQNSVISISEVGLWLTERQETASPLPPQIIHVRRIDENSSQLRDVTIFFFTSDYQLGQRIDATHAIVKDGVWQLENVHILNQGDDMPHKQNVLLYPTRINFSLLQDNFLPPESVSFWNFLEFISIMEQTGFSSQEHLFHYYQLWLMPLLALATALLGVAFSLHSNQHRVRDVTLGLASGFFLFQGAALLENIAILGRMPLFAAAAIPPLLAISLSFLLILREEDA